MRRLVPAVLVLAAVAVLAAPAGAKPATEDVLTPVLANVISPPEPVLTSDGQTQLAYEVQLINRTTSVATIHKLQALGDGRALQTLSGKGLEAQMQPYGAAKHSVKLSAGQGAYVLIDVSLARGAKVPKHLTHRLVVSLRPKQAAVGLDYDAAPTKVVDREAIVVAPPLRGPGWIVGNGCCSEFNAHRGTVLPVNGAAHVAERFAIDFVQLGPTGTLFSGPLDSLSSYPYFGDGIYSATAGKVVGVRDGLPEATPGSLPVNITAQEAGGNHVVVDMGHGRYAFYAHLQPGSVRVKAGQKVKVGQVLGLLGNTGNTDGPHLHFHIMDGPLPLSSNGLPYRFSNFSVEGTLATPIGALQEGAVAKIAPKGAGRRRAELPLNNQVIAFPGS